MWSERLAAVGKGLAGFAPQNQFTIKLNLDMYGESMKIESFNHICVKMYTCT